MLLTLCYTQCCLYRQELQAIVVCYKQVAESGVCCSFSFLFFFLLLICCNRMRETLQLIHDFSRCCCIYVMLKKDFNCTCCGGALRFTDSFQL